MPAPHANPDETPERPPILGSWRNIYVVVLSLLAFWIVAFYLFTVRYGPTE